MKILITGSSGLIGKALTHFLQVQGHHVVRLERKTGISTIDSIYWDPEKKVYDLTEFEGFDAVVNLAGENIASRRWTKAKKQRIYDSRVKTTELLSDCLIKLKNPPKVLVNASAVGFYGDHGDKVLTENNAAGSGFLAEVCNDWEKAASKVEGKGIRLVFLRFGTVLSTDGGALQTMLLPFKVGMGGIIGSGKQYISWITIDDLVRAVLFTIEQVTIHGPVNVVSPEPVTNALLTKTLGERLHRPTFLSMPAFVAKLVFGEMADDLLLGSIRAVPKRLTDAGFKFRYPLITDAIKHEVG